LDRPFTYDLAAELGGVVGSVVRVRFHGKLTRGWILGPTDDVPPRMLPVNKLVSPVRAFDPAMLELLRWVAERYVAPLAAVIDRAVPPRVAGEEGRVFAPAERRPPTPIGSVLPGYRGAGALLRAIGDPRDPGPEAFGLRPAPEDEAAVCADAVAACLEVGRAALVLVPEADPMPATATALRAAFGDRVGLFVGGDRRTRYRRWLEIARGRYDVVVATRPGVFAPLRDLGLIYVSREAHPAMREDRSPYYHVRDVVLTRARLGGAVCVLASLCPSAEADALGLPTAAPSGRRWPPVEVVRPGPEGRAPRLMQALREARRAFVFAPLPGYGIARVCRACGEPAACGSCGGLLRMSGGRVRCVVCEAEGRCARCGGTAFGIVRGGAERVEEWASSVASVPVRRAAEPRLPAPDGEIVIGGAEEVHDLGTGNLDLVAILDVDLAARRPGMAARERALAVWMEAVGWARPHGRAIVQASDPSDPAVQALVRGAAARFHERERGRREEAGFPVGAPVFRVAGTRALTEELAALEPITLLTTTDPLDEERAVCLLALAPDRVPAFGTLMRELAPRGVVERVEADPHL
jgi:primosomal protein N' (replication factor Y) (superfamily II helicase)